MIHNYHACLSTHSEFPLLQLFCSPNIHMRTGLSIAQFSSHQFVSLLNNKYSIYNSNYALKQIIKSFLTFSVVRQFIRKHGTRFACFNIKYHLNKTRHFAASLITMCYRNLCLLQVIKHILKQDTLHIPSYTCFSYA